MASGAQGLDNEIPIWVSEFFQNMRPAFIALGVLCLCSFAAGPAMAEPVEMSQDNFTLYYPVPSYEEPGTFEPYSWGLLYRDWLGYDRLGPFHEQPLGRCTRSKSRPIPPT